ncbi:MAG: hypothetical protein KAJ04_09765 [Candidatus Eisenbacteria sp.]|nr:hypothetical protein [Candidatus Eisenbacteria bacterium]
MQAKTIGPLLGIVVLAVLWVGSAPGGEGTELYGRLYTSTGDTLWVEEGGHTWEVLGDQVTIIPQTGLTDAGVDSLLADLGYGVLFVGPDRAYFDLGIPDTSDAVGVLGTCLTRDAIDDAWANTRAQLAAAPSDSFYSEHIGWWRQWNLRRINAEEAWSIETGDTTVVIAVLDTGIELEHDDLKGNLWINWSEYYGTASADDDSNSYVDDIYGINVDDENGDVGEVGGHGTQVSWRPRRTTTGQESPASPAAGTMRAGRSATEGVDVSF